MVIPKIPITDDQALLNWDQKYQVKQSPNLWGNVDAHLNTQIMEAIGFLKVSNSQTVLEIPCGDGRNTILLSQKVPFLIAIDSSHQALALASKALVSQHRTNVLLQQGNIYDTDFVDNSFDAVFCWDLLGHLQQPNCALSEMLRICKPGHRIVGSLFSIGDSTRGIDMTSVGKSEEYLYANQFYFKFYTEAEVQHMLRLQLNADLITLYTAQWTDPPHEGYCEYPHNHESWVFVLEKKG